MKRRTNLREHQSSESGQVIIIVVLVLGLFALGVLALAVDYTNAWSRKQAAQNAGDAACTAAAMDMLYGTDNFPVDGSSVIDCASSPSIAPCQYASMNGYDGSTGNSVKISFPSSVAGLRDCTSTTATPVCSATGVVENAFVQVEVTDQVPLTFARMLTSSATVSAKTLSTCGLVLSSSPIPILVLNPSQKDTFKLGGTGSVNKITISGGPQRSIQVNSTSSAAVNGNGNPVVDLTNAGTTGGGGGILGVSGGPATASAASVTLQPSPNNYQHTGPIMDPLMRLPAPTKPIGTTPAPTAVVPSDNVGCPDSGGCIQYHPGYYPTGIEVKNQTAIFDPGIYYLDAATTGSCKGVAFCVQSNSCLRPSNQTSTGDNAIGGTMFYFNSGTVTVDSNSGSKCTTTFNPTASDGTGQLQFGVKCTAASDVPANIASATITGNVLLGPCTGTYGDPLLTDDPIGEQRGVVFFQNRSTQNVQASWGGNGSSAIVGTLYFHDCQSANGTGAGTRCSTSAYTNSFSLSGTSGSTSYVAGEIITDYLDMSGTPVLNMYLNPSALYYVLKATLLPSYQVP